MVVCRYFLQGNCRFGANCRNEHPSGQGGGGGGGGGGNSGGGGGGFGNQNRFGALSNSGTSGNQGTKQWSLNTADIRLDLTKGQGRPSWILSTYGAGRNTPASLFEGNEYSPEELRARFYEMASKGQEAQADQEAVQLWSKAEEDMGNVASHIDDITKFMEEAEKKHPNRYDLLKTDGTKTRDELMNPGGTSNAVSSGFGTTSTFGQSTNTPNNPFSKPAAATFGQPSGPSAFGASAFGKPAQPSAFGQSAFGQPNTASTFGQPAAASAFGKPAFGNSGFGQSGFGQTSQPASTAAFGQSAQPVTPAAFGQSSQPATGAAFGQPSSQSGFGAPAFGQSAKPGAFGTPPANAGFGASTTAFGQPAQPSTAFGQPSQSSSPFAQPPQPTAGFGQTAFGQPNQPSGFGKTAFGQPAQAVSGSPFGQAANNNSGFGSNASTGGFGQAPQQNASPFGRPAAPSTAEVSMDADATPQTNAPQTPFGVQQPAALTAPNAPNIPNAPGTAGPGTPATAKPNVNTSQTPHVLTSKPPRPLHYTQTLPLIPPEMDRNQYLTSYRGIKVDYVGDEGAKVPCYDRPDRQGQERIWFPNAGSTQEVVALNREDKVLDLQAEDDKYSGEVRQQFALLLDEGRFKDGKIPLVPPMRNWCLYDL